MATSQSDEAKFNIPSILAVVAVIGSFAVGAFWGFILAVVAIVFAVIGIVMAVTPSRRGGIMSILALLAGGIALIAAVVKAALWLF